MMDCPKCGARTRVLDTREAASVMGNCVRRRRRCVMKKCGFRYTTLEVGGGDLRAFVDKTLAASGRVVEGLSELKRGLGPFFGGKR